MLKGNRLLCLTLLPIFITPSTIKPFHNQAWQHIENKVDAKEMVQIQDYRLKKFQEQFEKDKIELEKKKTEEIKKQKQKKNEPQWQEFILTFYTSLNSENGYGSITCTGSKLYDGIVASNYYKLNTKIQLEGWGEVVVADRGGSNFSNDYRLDVYVPRNKGESDSRYFSRVNKMGKIKVNGILIK